MNVLRRIFRIIIGKNGIYCEMGKHNHFAKGVIIYEHAHLGNYNYFSPYSIVNNAYIGNYCSIGPGVKIGLGEHDMDAVSLRPIVANGDGKMQIFNINNPAVIGHDVWIGANTVIMQGVKIGNGAVIGAGSIVTKDVPAYAVAYGTPARVVKNRFNDDITKIIEEKHWYDYDLREAKMTVLKIREDISV